MSRVIETTEDIVEKGEDVIDPKIIPTGSVGVVEGTIVKGHSIWVNFGRGAHRVAVSEHIIKNLPSDPDELERYLKER